MATDLKLKTGTISNYNKIASKETGTIYFATDSDGRAYIYLNGNNIVPKMVDLRNGGLGVDYSNSTTYPAYSVIMLGSDGETTTTSAPAAGAFYTDASSNKPKFGTLPVAQGGLGKTSITKGAILYGNTSSTTGAVAALSPGTNGYVLVSSGSAPKYVQPTMTWTNGSDKGPIFKFTFNGQPITNTDEETARIPIASDSISGVMTTGVQKFAGEKTFISTIYTSSVYPRVSNGYSLGYWTSSSDNRVWNTLHTNHLRFYDSNNVLAGNSMYENGTASATGVMHLYLGNSTKTGTTGNSRGQLHLYSTGVGKSSLQYVATDTDTTQTIPQATGNVMISSTSAYNTTTASTFYIPFYSSTSSTTMKLGYNDGFRLRHDNGDTTTTSGVSYLYLGNESAVGTAGNKAGGLYMFGDNSGNTALYPNKDNGTNHHAIYLPAASGELVYHTEDSAQGGAGTDSSSNATYKPVHVSAVGSVTAASSTVASSTRLMYMNSGALTASTANVANGKKQLMYLSNGTLTASDADVASNVELMYLLDGVLTKSAASVANGKKQLMYLASGKLTASDADEGSGARPVYLLDGVITASSSTIASGTQLMYMSNGSLTASTADVGSATQPVYLLDGVVTAAGAYSSLLTAFSGSSSATDNTASITVGGTTKTATIIGGVSNTWANGTTNGPTLSTTVNGVTGTAVQIPNASYSYSGAVTTSTQTFKGVKTFGDGMKVSASGSTTDCATFTYDASTDTLTISFP